jgi:hypothetical protein
MIDTLTITFELKTYDNNVMSEMVINSKEGVLLWD